MKCLNVIVFYNNRDEVKQYIMDLERNSPNLVDIALVINLDSGKEVDSLICELNHSGNYSIQKYDFGENVGYLNSLLRVINLISVDDYEYIVLSNTDIHYKTDGFFSCLLSNRYDSSIGCIAPSVFQTKSMSYANPHYLERVEKTKLERLERIFSYPMIGRMYLKLAEYKSRQKKKEKTDSCYVYSPHGCYMIFSRSFIEKITKFKYGVKMYSEESCIGELLVVNGLKCYYDSSIEVVHQESSVTGHIDYKKRFNMWKESLRYIIDTFY